MTTYWAAHALLPDGSPTACGSTVDDGRFTAVTPEAPRRAGDDPAPRRRAARVRQRALATPSTGRCAGARTASGGTFWTWRDRMYAVAARLDPDSYLALARAVFAEMALAGVTAVGEFHYLHHAPGGRPYADPNAMGRRPASQAAARRRDPADPARHLLPRRRPDGDGHLPLDAVQQRFSDGDVDALGRAGRRALRPTTDAADRRGRPLGAGRAARATLPVVGARRRGRAPLHVHLCEQPAENAACLDVLRRARPTELLADAGAARRPRRPRCTPPTSPTPTSRCSARRGTTACFCPTTERDLADGIGPARALRDAGAPLALGSDQHAVIDPFEEARGLEMHERLRPAASAAASRRPTCSRRDRRTARSLGWPDAGRLARRRPRRPRRRPRSTRSARRAPARRR